MTNTPISTSISAATPLSREYAATLVEQIVQLVTSRVEDKVWRAGIRMPSIRRFAEQYGVSRFTVVEAYDRLVASGLLESRRGSGFYVRDQTPVVTPQVRSTAPTIPRSLDVVWLIRNMFRQTATHQMPGVGSLPSNWLDNELVGNALRSVARQNIDLLQYGEPQGFLPLRQQLQRKLAELDIAATPDQIVTTTGVTQALDIVARHFVQPGDTVFVDDPAWFLMFGSFAMLGANVVGIPRLPDGPDIARLTELAALHRPRLFVINSVLHNPTSTSLSAAKAFQMLKLAEQFDFMIVEDDIYCDMHPGHAIQPATRIATLDQLQRVIYLGGFSKTLAASLRIGFIAAAPELVRHLSDRKILSTLTTTELTERVLYRILSEGHYRKHADRLRSKLDAVRDRTVRQMERIGLQIPVQAPAGMFLWADMGCDTNVLTTTALEASYLLAPGSLFSPNQLPSRFMRFNIAAMDDPGIVRFLQKALDKA
ncbi:PLP-dependent aminotransferase family protein [uncultured Oxalicibacterium sp.]|uniref:aminotransferase-like domain-containing protein n=1 Tax=uncultured Oxalicibacterium sp. TaxID=1168540 RepID=UPI0025CD4B30|nr:PLP-dependent aminotransferase family protein [uncultured Oxalicibacterium sp.]